MSKKRRVWIDPPSGWMYGFPKICEDASRIVVHDWLVEQGYPEDLITPGIIVRIWTAEDTDSEHA